MTKIAESRTDPKLIRVAEALTAQGFNIHFLGSRRYLRTKLMTLTQEELMRVKQAISTGISHPKLLKKLTRKERIFGYKKRRSYISERGRHREIGRTHLHIRNPATNKDIPNLGKEAITMNNLKRRDIEEAEK